MLESDVVGPAPRGLRLQLEQAVMSCFHWLSAAVCKCRILHRGRGVSFVSLHTGSYAGVFVIFDEIRPKPWWIRES